MSFILKGSNGIGTIEKTAIDHEGYRDAARHLINLYEDGHVSDSDRSGDAGTVFKFFGAGSYDELKSKIESGY